MRFQRGVLCAAATMLAAAACSAGNQTPTASRTPTYQTGSGCGHGIASGTTTLHLSIGGRQRLVLVHIPTGYSPSRHVPLVLNLHGSGSTAVQQEAFSGMDTTADSDGFIVAYPQGDIPSGQGFDWNVPDEPLLGGSSPPSTAPNDVTFLTDLVPELARRYCIDRHRVFVTGMSGGARMASQLGCDAPETFAAVAPVAGLRYPSPCAASRRPVSIIAFHGTADPIDPYDGHGQAYWTYSVPTAAARWAAHDGCRKAPDVSKEAGYTLTHYTGCSAGTTVELYSLTGEGHEWPGGPTMPNAITSVLGAQSNAVNADAVMWAFFRSTTT